VRLPANFALLLTLLVATGAQAADVVVDVESMIGEAVLIRKTSDGQTDTIVIPTGQATQTDPTTGETALGAATLPNKVTEVVRAIAATSPDGNADATAEGCSRSDSPIRPTANPANDPELEGEIRRMLSELSEGELMMVIAVLNNNARHLCTDAFAVNSAIGSIATVRPEVAAQVVFVAALVDPANAEQFVTTAQAAAPGESSNIQQAANAANSARDEFGTNPPPPPPPQGGPQGSDDPADTQNDVPSGGEPPSKE